MPKKTNAEKSAGKKLKKGAKEEPPEEHKSKHGPDVKRLLEEYEHKAEDVMDEEEFLSQQIGSDDIEESEKF